MKSISNLYSNENWIFLFKLFMEAYSPKGSTSISPTVWQCGYNEPLKFVMGLCSEKTNIRIGMWN